MYFSGEDAEVIYIIVSIKLHIGNDVGSCHCVCDVLDYNIGTWCSCDDVTITKYSGYPKNVNDNISKDNEKKKGNISIWMYPIVFCQNYIFK